MKKIILPFLFLLSYFSYGQPKLAGSLEYSGAKNGGAIFRRDLPAAGPGIVFSFDNSGPQMPSNGVTAGDGNWLYGATINGGTNQHGAFYRVQKDGTGFTTLFNYVNDVFTASVVTPYYHTDGKVYFNDNTDIKSYDPSNGTFTSLNTSSGPVTKNFWIDSDDWMYYFENYSGTRLVKIQTNGTSWTDLHDFNFLTEGFYGKGGVTEIPGDTLFGFTTFSSTGNGGILFSILKDGTGFNICHQFDNATGVAPESRLVYFGGKIYGTTSAGGALNNGVLFCVNADGSGYRVLHDFDPGPFPVFNSSPAGNIAISSNGRIFGSFNDFLYTTDYERLWKIDTSGNDFEAFFTGNSTDKDRGNGRAGQDVLLLNDDSIYVVDQNSGRFDGGVLNYCDTTGFAWTDSYHYGFSSTGFRTNSIIKATDGKLYGTTLIGGTTGNGLVFSMNADGTGYTKLHEFSDAEGYALYGKLLEASDGKLYGACQQGGPSNTGCLYRINKNGTGFQVIYQFPDFTKGYYPRGSLVEGAPGTLYGVTFYVSSGSGTGTVFKINTDGSNYTVLNFFNVSGQIGNPYDGVKLMGNYLYGTCGTGGSGGLGGIYRIRTDGTGYQVMHEFSGPDGYLPLSQPVIAPNGKMYGVTVFGGSGSVGTIFSIDTTGTNFTVLKHLNQTTDGGYPWGGIIQASDGLIYGCTTFGTTGSEGGDIFKMNLDGSGFALVDSFAFDTQGQGIYSLIDLNGSVGLPVTMLSFTGEKKGGTVLLNWKTAQERNSSRFDIERSANGVSFAKIGSLPAAGNSNNVTSYNFTDNSPGNGLNFYRLRQLDLDGQTAYSKVISIKFDAAGSIVLSPNPASDMLNIHLPANNGFTGLSIFDASGKLVLKKEVLTSGSGITVDISSLSRGWYLVNLQGKENAQIPFMKN